MPPGRAASRARAVRLIIALTAVSACLGAVAYAATHPQRPIPSLGESRSVDIASPHRDGSPPSAGEEKLLRARFIEQPAAVSIEADAQFRFHVPPRSSQPGAPMAAAPGGTPPTRRFQCRLDGDGWKACSSPYRLTAPALGEHVLAVRALNRAGRPGPAVSYSWWQVQPSPPQPAVDPKPFSIELQGTLEDLHPGFPPQQVPVLVTNPNPVAIEVTSLTVAIAGDSPACSAENFALTPSSASATAPLVVPAGGSVGLPTATTSAPAIAMLNLVVDQDACQGAEVPLVFDGEAHG